VVADLDEARWEDVLKETPDELHHLEGHGPPAAAPWFFVAEEDGAVFDFDDAAIGDGHFEDIGSEVSERVLAGSCSLAVDVPIGLPYLRWDEAKESSLGDLIAEFRSEEPG